jgi:hypothetical protein
MPMPMGAMAWIGSRMLMLSESARATHATWRDTNCATHDSDDTDL